MGAVLAALLGLVLAGTASAATLRGVVVHRNARAHSFAIALRGGRLVSVHARGNVAVGRVVLVSARRLRNGTFAVRSVKVGRSAHRARVRGVVTFVDRRQGMFTVSAKGVSVLIRSHRIARAADALPSVGEQVEVETQIDDQGDLEDQGVQSVGAQTQNAHLEGTILAIDPSARTLTISADDDDQSGQSLTVDVPPTIDISAFTVGQEVELATTIQPDGSFLLQASSEDDNAEQANNPGDQQGSDGSDGSSSGGSDGSGSGESDGSGSTTISGTVSGD
jgi:hypothetical protein